MATATLPAHLWDRLMASAPANDDEIVRGDVLPEPLLKDMLVCLDDGLAFFSVHARQGITLIIALRMEYEEMHKQDPVKAEQLKDEAMIAMQYVAAVGGLDFDRSNGLERMRQGQERFILKREAAFAELEEVVGGGLAHAYEIHF